MNKLDRRECTIKLNMLGKLYWIHIKVEWIDNNSGKSIGTISI